MTPTLRSTSIATGVLLAIASGAAADSVTLTPQNPNETGFVVNSGTLFPDEIATGGLFFATGEPWARGFARFDLGSIPAGSTIDAVRLVTWAVNHDISARTACPKDYHIGRADVDPLTALGTDIFAAIAAGPIYVDATLARTGATFCPENFVELDIDLALGIADVEAALPNGYFTIGLQSDRPCDVTQDHIDWIGYSESLGAPDPGCAMFVLPGSRIRLEVTYTPPVGGCDILAVAAVGNLQAVKGLTRNDVELSWTADGEADGYNVWFVDLKSDIPNARQGATGANPPGCGPTGVASCAHTGAVPPTPTGSRVYYQVRGACGSNEAAE